MEERMKKIKGFLLFFVCCLLSCLTALMFTACTKESADKTDGQTVGSDGGNQSAAADTGSDTVTYLNSLQVDYADAKREFTIGQEFTSDGLKVTALITEQGTSISTNSVDVTKDAEIDASAFNNKKAGDYKIYISYTYGGTTLYANYTVKVVSAIEGTIAGLVMDYDGDRQTELSVDVTKASIDLSGLKVSLITGENANNTQTEELARSAYSLSYSKDGGEFNPIAEDKTAITDLTRGTYSFFASAEYQEGEETFTMTSFFTFYVLDPVVSIVKDSGGTTSFEYDTDEVIGSDWTYTVTYASGATEKFGYDDVEMGKTVNDEEGAQSVTVTYTEEQLGFDSALNDAVAQTYSQSCDVSYEIGENPNAGAEVEETITVNISDIDKTQFADPGAISENIDLSGDGAIIATATADANIKITDNKKSIDGFSFTQRLQLNGAGSAESKSIKITTKGAATITVYGMSGSSNTVRPLALYDSSFTAMNQSYDNDGNAIAKFTYMVDAAGTYYIASNNGFNIYYVSFTQKYTSGGAMTPEPVTVNASTLAAGTLTAPLAVTDDESVVILASAENTVVIEANKKELNGITITNRIKLGGAGSIDARSIKITTQGAATITIYGMSSSSSAAREVALMNSEFVAIDSQYNAVGGTSLNELTFEVSEAGTYYFACLSGGFNVYYIAIDY